MQASVARRSVDLSAYPDLVVILLGFRVRRLRGLATMLGIGKGLKQIDRNPPEGLLANEQFLFSLTHVGIRQYWRDLESLEAFTRSEPHAHWWRDFLRDSGGAGFWHESYSRRGMEAVYVDMPGPVGFGRFAPPRQPTGPFLTARQRMEMEAA
ncbi:monooxygenase family protein [Pseudaminobacter soli (ex Li et al. 2025)]|uniref:DUF4188 domain-containing protein n=1 Tax=Pseudaminobacter soli (ex Li et al. 2025) TaxID=1295366 RepID=A0A2P7RSN1_9HYPH|nr:DUF4188 domain-containing protein [Mesorhizobium soli]PSJ53203.1 DUF4188 domain-containing protein [Mesorhizobium soli]